MFEITTVPFDLDEALSLLAKLSARKDFWEYKAADGTQTFRGNKLPDLGKYVLSGQMNVWVDLRRCPSLEEATMLFDNAPDLCSSGPSVHWDLKAKSGDDCDIGFYAGSHWLGGGITVVYMDEKDGSEILFSRAAEALCRMCGISDSVQLEPEETGAHVRLVGDRLVPLDDAMRDTEKRAGVRSVWGGIAPGRRIVDLNAYDVRTGKDIPICMRYGNSAT